MFIMFACISLVAFTITLDKDNKKEDVQIQCEADSCN